MKLNLQLFLTALLIIFVTNAFGQISFDSQEDLEKAANEAFNEKDFEKAKPLFSQLLSLNALDPNYNYRFGVCLLFTEADPLKPLPYIEGGANTAGVNPEAFYFLGKAYQLNYRFDEAISSFEKGKKSGLSASWIDLEKSIQECRNGKLLYNAAIEFDPAQDKEVIEAEFYRPYDFRKLKGKVIPMPPNFKTKYDEKNLKGTFVYTPSNSQTLFFASYGEDGGNAKDLYRVNRLPNGEWALPQRLPDVINTKYDEDFAFYDDETSALYFASKGHNTMGGYDIFRSVYDPNKHDWSQPINLQFPINSPYDDFLYVSDPEGKVAFFTSKRETEIGKIRVLKTLLHDPEKVELSIVEGTFEDKTDSIYNYMLATVFDPKTNQVVGKYRSNKETGKYLLILPPQNDYTMDVGPREAAGFKFDIDVPQHEPTKPLEQNLAYDNSNGEGTVTLTNYFDAAGNPDSVAVAMNRPKEEVESAMVEMPDAAELLAAREAERKKLEVEKEAELAKLAAAEEAKLAAEKAKQDSLLAVKNAAIEAEAARLKAESARKDSIANAQVFAVAREKATADSIARVEALALEAAAEREEFIADSIAKAEEIAAQLASDQEKAFADSIAKAEEQTLLAAAEREQFVVDSASKAEEKALMMAAEREVAIADSIAKAEEMASAAAEREKFLADSVKRAEELDREIAEKQARLDSLKALASLEEQDQTHQTKEVAENLAADQLVEQKRQENLAKLEEIKKEKQLAAEREKAVADSIAKVEEVALAKAEQAKADSIAEAEAEKERLVQIASEVEEAKARALRDSVVEADVAVAESDQEANYDDILKEMQEKEAEILAQDKPTSEEVAPAEQIVDSLESKEVITEADLFLQTIADMESQKKQQEAEIAAENERLAQEKAAKAQKEIAKRDSISVEASESMASASDSTSSDIDKPVKVEGEKDLEQESLALKSDADPNEYLKALAEIEVAMAEDDAKNSKSYELQDLTAAGKEVDPVLEARIAADRKALEEHQRIAAEKEAALKEQMQRDKQVVDNVVKEEEDELAAIEAELLEGLENQNEPQEVAAEEQADVIAEADELIVEEKPMDVETAETEVTEPSEVVQKEAEEVVDEVKEEVAETTLEQEEIESVGQSDLEQELIAEADQVLNEVVLEEAPVEVVEIEGTETADAKEVEVEMESEPVVEPEEELVAEADEVMEEILEEEGKVAVATETAEEAIAEQVEEVESTENVEEPTTANEVDEEVKAVESSIDEEEMVVAESGVGRIPFLTPALRDYSKRKADFSGISDKSMKRMVQRMRAEDVGRLAVLKNMKNQWVDAGKTQESLREIKSNTRNQDVLADVAERPAREEIIREPFNKNDLRERENVFYKLDVKLTSAGVSETVSEAMTPEQSITFFMPEFQVSTGYFTSLADAEAEKKYYKNRGFETVQVVVFHNGEQIRLSDVTSIPFVD